MAKVSLHGIQDEIIYVEYNNAQLAELGISLTQLSNTLASLNILSSGGNILNGRERIILEPTGNLESLEAIERVAIALPNGALVNLGDIATVTRDYVNPPESLARVNGNRAIALAVSLRDGGDSLKLGERLNELIPQIEESYPWGVSIEKIWYQSSLVKTNVDNFVTNLGQAIGIVILVMVLFLGLKIGLVVALLIPTSMVITFFVMQQFGITVNQISLAALIIALGLLVDNAIVMVESILVKRNAGMGAYDAAVDAGKELKMPLLVSSLTTGAAFMPIALAESAVGEYTADIFYVVTIALLVSWLLAMTFIPLASMYLIKTKPQAEGSEDENQAQEGRWYGLYKNILTSALKHKTMFFLLVVAVFYSAIKAFSFVPVIFIAPSDDPVFSGKLELPLGTAIENTEKTIATIDQFIHKNYFKPETGDPLIKNWMIFIGEGGPRFTLGLDPPNPNAANSFLIANVYDGKTVPTIIAGINQFILENFPDMQTQIARLENGPPVGYPVVIKLVGAEVDELFALASRVSDHLYTIPTITGIKNTWGLQTKKLIVGVDQDRAIRAGVSNADVAYSLNASLKGIDLSEFREDDKLIPIRLRSESADREDIDKLDGMSVYSQTTGRTVPLKQVADVHLGFEAGVIEREDRSRTLSLKLQLQEGVTATTMNQQLIPWLDSNSQNWPKGYHWEIGGESEESDNANAAIGAKLPLALMVIILLLVVQFNSIRRPIIILTTIPLGIIGVAYGLLIGQSSFGFFTILGIISLSGIIINNAIVLIDRILIENEELGKPIQQAIVDACVQRVRPIMLTTATTVLGMMPLWWGGTAMFKPMAVSIIFGLAFATMLTLLVVPVLYAALFRVKFK